MSGDGTDPVKHKLGLYLPKNHKDSGAVFVHGGACSGDKLYFKLGEIFAPIRRGRH